MPRMEIPVIGIGAGPATDGQVLVFHDLLGIYDGHAARFVKRYADVREEMVKGVAGLRRRRARAPLPGARARLHDGPGRDRAPARGAGHPDRRAVHGRPEPLGSRNSSTAPRVLRIRRRSFPASILKSRTTLHRRQPNAEVQTHERSTLRRPRRHVVACLSLFLTLGGVGYAAATINGNSIKKARLRPAKLKQRSLSGTQIRAKASAARPSRNRRSARCRRRRPPRRPPRPTTRRSSAGHRDQLPALWHQRACGQTVTGSFGCCGRSPCLRPTVASWSRCRPGAAALTDGVNFAAARRLRRGRRRPDLPGNANNPAAPPQGLPLLRQPARRHQHPDRRQATS